MKLSKEQRYSAYCVMLYYADTYPEYWEEVCLGFCKLMRCLWCNDDIRDFSELERHEPEELEWDGYWFSQDKKGWQRRRAILEKITKELEVELYGKKKK